MSCPKIGDNSFPGDDKGKLSESWGRKATGLPLKVMTAGLPKQSLVRHSYQQQDAMQQFQAADDRARTSLIILTIIAVILGAAFAVILARKISAPIVQASNKIAQIARGDLTTDAIIVSSQDEVGQMVQSINKMAEDLRTLVLKTKESSDLIASSAEEFSVSTEELLSQCLRHN